VYWWADPALPYGPQDDNIYKTITHNSYLSRFGVYAGIYSQELENEVVGCVNGYLPSQAKLIDQNGDWFPVLPAAMKVQTAMSTKINSKGDINILDWTDLNWYFRPHSKEELEVAGLWPTGE
jgi:hypothetical protein